MNPDDFSDSESRPEEEPVQGQVRHQSLSAVVPKEVSGGQFSNGVLILTGPHEVVLDFLMRLGEQQRVVARVILPHAVGRQFAAALDHDLRVYEAQYGQLPRVPRPLPRPSTSENQPRPEPKPESASHDEPVPPPQIHPENLPEPPRNPPTVDEIYQDLKVTDEVLTGAYANSVLIRHSGTEFCFDFITNIYPRSAVSARLFVATPHVPPLLNSLIRALQIPGDGPRFA